jgi:hypothetical protein
VTTAYLTTGGLLGGSLGLTTDGVLGVRGALVVTGIDTTTVGADGGWRIVLSGTFTVGAAYTVGILNVVTGSTYTATSGVAGSAGAVVSLDGGTLSCWTPEAPPGVYSVVATAAVGGATATLASALTVLHRSYTTNLYSLRSAWPPPRDVGPYSIEDEP